MSNDEDEPPQQGPALHLSVGDYGGHVQEATLSTRPRSGPLQTWAPFPTPPHMGEGRSRVLEPHKTGTLACGLRGGSRKADDTTGGPSVRISYR